MVFDSFDLQKDQIHPSTRTTVPLILTPQFLSLPTTQYNNYLALRYPRKFPLFHAVGQNAVSPAGPPKTSIHKRLASSRRCALHQMRLSLSVVPESVGFSMLKHG